jgi:hypothetical protein
LSTTPDGPLTIALNGIKTFTPTVQDANGNALPGVFFQWDLNGVGDGTVNATRSGDSCNITNEIFDSAGAQMGYGSGISAVDYVCRVRGVDCVHETKAVTFSN